MNSTSFSAAGWRYRFKSLFARAPHGGDVIPLTLSIMIGLLTGFGAYIFILLLGEISRFTTSLRHDYGTPASFIVMGSAGLLTGLIIARFAREAKGHGVPEVMEAIALKRGRIRPRVAVAKICASAITIGAGGSAGREGPIVQVGSALGSTIGQLFKLSDEQMRMLVASGAAAGIAATFNAPIAGCMFALEVILGHFSNRYLGMVVVSAVSANVVSRSLLGETAAFHVPVYALHSALELPLYMLLAVLCALGAILFIRVLYGAEHIFDSIRLPLPARTTIGMLLTGLVAMGSPEVLGPGLEFIGDAIAEDMSITIVTMGGFFLFKLLATTFTLGAGNSGGVFAPGLFMGAMLGGIIGQIGYQLWPNVVVDPGAFALVGMAALFAGAARSPLTAIIIVLEMSNDYRLILPLLMTVILTTLLAEFLHPDSIYTRKLSLRGIRLKSGQDIDLLQAVKVGEVMTRDYITVSPQLTLHDLMPEFNQSHHHGFPIVDNEKHLCGIITLSDIEFAHEADIPDDKPVMAVGTISNLITVYPDDPIYLALHRMNLYNIGRLPVVERANGNNYLGMIRRVDILKAYDIALHRKSVEQHREKHFKLRDMEENAFIEVVVEPGAPMVGHTLKEFPCSDDCLLVSVRRDGHAMIAHGDTRIEVGDRITAYAHQDAYETVHEQFTGKETPVAK